MWSPVRSPGTTAPGTSPAWYRSRSTGSGCATAVASRSRTPAHPVRSALGERGRPAGRDDTIAPFTRDNTGLIHFEGDFPREVPKHWTPEQLEEQASELEASIRARELDNARRGGDATRAGPTHRDRIEKEREFLRRIQKRLSGS